MKPTKEIIELAKKLYELGHRQELHDDTWLLHPVSGECQVGSKIIAYVYSSIKYIPIPSLEDGLNWLRENALHLHIWIDKDSGKWVCECRGGLSNYEADTLHVAILKAVIQVKAREDTIDFDSEKRA